MYTKVKMNDVLLWFVNAIYRIRIELITTSFIHDTGWWRFRQSFARWHRASCAPVLPAFGSYDKLWKGLVL